MRKHFLVGNQHGYVHPIQNLLRLPHPLLSQRAHIVIARSIDDDHRTDGQKLHGLLHRIRRGALRVADHGKLLLRDPVHKAGLAHVPTTEKADMKPL